MQLDPSFPEFRESDASPLEIIVTLEGNGTGCARFPAASET